MSSSRSTSRSVACIRCGAPLSEGEWLLGDKCVKCAPDLEDGASFGKAMGERATEAMTQLLIAGHDYDDLLRLVDAAMKRAD